MEHKERSLLFRAAEELKYFLESGEVDLTGLDVSQTEDTYKDICQALYDDACGKIVQEPKRVMKVSL